MNCIVIGRKSCWAFPARDEEQGKARAARILSLETLAVADKVQGVDKDGFWEAQKVELPPVVRSSRKPIVVRPSPFDAIYMTRHQTEREREAFNGPAS